MNHADQVMPQKAIVGEQGMSEFLAENTDLEVNQVKNESRESSESCAQACGLSKGVLRIQLILHKNAGFSEEQEEHWFCRHCLEDGDARECNYIYSFPMSWMPDCAIFCSQFLPSNRIVFVMLHGGCTSDGSSKHHTLIPTSLGFDLGV